MKFVMIFKFSNIYYIHLSINYKKYYISTYYILYLLYAYNITQHTNRYYNNYGIINSIRYIIMVFLLRILYCIDVDVINLNLLLGKNNVGTMTCCIILTKIQIRIYNYI